MATTTSVFTDTNFAPFLSATAARPRTLKLKTSAAAVAAAAPNRLLLQLTQAGTYLGKVDVSEARLVEQLASGQRRLILVLDVSGSMSSYYEYQRQAALNLVAAVQAAQLPQGVCYILFFSSAVLGEYDAADAETEMRIRGLGMGGGTSFAAPWRRIVALHAQNPQAHLDVFFSTDGEDTFMSWEPLVTAVKQTLTSDSHVQPVYFGTAPTPSTTTRRGASVFSQQPTQAETTRAKYVEELGQMAVNCSLYRVTHITALCELIARSVESLAAELTGTVQLPGGVGEVSIFNNGERCVGIVHRRFAADEVLVGDRVVLTLSTGQVVDLVVDITTQPLTVQEETQCFMQNVASRLLALRTTLRDAYQGRPAAVQAVGALITTLREEQRRLHIAESDPFAVKLKAAVTELESLTLRAGHTPQPATTAAATKFAVHGTGNAWAQLGSTIRWQATTEHGAARKVKRANRARQVVANLLATHARTVATDVQKLAELVPALFWEDAIVTVPAGTQTFVCVLPARARSVAQLWVATTDDMLLEAVGLELVVEAVGANVVQTVTELATYRITLAQPVPQDTEIRVRVCVQDTPTDPLTLDTTGWGQVIAILAGPGIAFTVEQIDAMDPLTTAAIQNPGAAHGTVQCLLSPLSFSQCLAEQTQLFRTSMVGVPAVPWQAAARTPTQEGVVQVGKNLFPFMTLTGIVGRGSARAIDVFPALAWSMCSQMPADGEKLATALLLLPYWYAAAAHQRRLAATRPGAVEQTVLQNVVDYKPCWNAIALSNAENGDAVWSNVPLAVMTTLAVHLCCPDASVPWTRVPAAVLETARQGLSYQLTHQPADWLAAQLAPVVTGLAVPAHLGPAESMTVEEMADRLSPHLKALFLPATTPDDVQALDTILTNASRLVWTSAPATLTATHPSVVAARAFLWHLAATPTQRPAPHLQLPRESWAVLLGTWQRLTALCPTPTMTAATVDRANANNGWLRAQDAERVLTLPAGPTDATLLDTVLSPWELVWLALVLGKTQGQTSKLRELGVLTTPAEAQQVVDAAFVTAWVPDTDTTHQARQAARLAYYRGVATLLHDRRLAKELHPLILIGWLKLVVRRIAPTEPGYLALFKEGLTVLHTKHAWIQMDRPDVYAAFMTMVPAGLLATDPDVTTLVCGLWRAGFAVWSASVVAQRVDALPAGLLAVPAIQTLLRSVGVADSVWQHRMTAPGTTTAIPGSQRFNRHLLTLLKKYNPALFEQYPTRWRDRTTPVTVYLVVEGTHPEEITTDATLGQLLCVTLPAQDTLTTLFASEHGASSIRFITTVNSWLCDQVCFWDGTVQTFALPKPRGPFKSSGQAIRTWDQTWCSRMQHWRTSVLVKRVSETEAGAAPASGTARTTTTTTVAADTLDTIVHSVRELFAALRPVE